MNRSLIGICTVLAAMLLTATAACAPFADASEALFQGKFTGMAFSDRDTSAPLTLNLTQIGNAVNGTATIGNGLTVDTGGFICPGVVNVPSGRIDVSGSVSETDPRHLDATSSLSTSGITITAQVVSELSQDGNTMDISLDLKIPWPCKSSTIKAKLTRS